MNTCWHKSKGFSILNTFEVDFDAMKETGGSFGLIKLENLGRISNLTHFITSRIGGVSLPPYDSLNLGLHTNDNSDHVLINRALLAKATGIEKERFLYASQVHSGDVKIIDSNAIENGVLSQNPRTDATITALPGICLMVMVADCVPVLLFDPVRKVSAVIHAGWRGTVHQITSNTIHAMVKHFGCNPVDILAGIGPSIGACCYEVGEDVREFVAQSFGTTAGYLIQQPDSVKPHFDLWYANHKQLTDNGVKPGNIETSGLCTRCHSETFFSSRASGGITGRFAAGICILPPENL
jgi:YfiH family protein